MADDSVIVLYRCGGGTRSRTRRHQAPGQCASLKGFSCPHKELRQVEKCNIACPNGGSPSSTGCSCTPAWSGNCCHQRRLFILFVILLMGSSANSVRLMPQSQMK